ncbi:MAG: metallophosphoesterase family protein [Chloroflexota bacterium]
MKALILGDIHGNLEAFQAVLGHAARMEGFQEVWCLGDVVGYGPDPGACVDLLQEQSPVTVAGNHDRAAVGLLGLDEFNPYAAEACRWTASKLSETQKTYLRGLPLVLTQGPFTLVHGSLRDPVWEYLLDAEAAQATLALLQTRRCLVAHSHIPFLCRDGSPYPLFERLPEAKPMPLGQGRAVVNPGSVGQPRDGDPRAAYILYDADAGSVTLHRVEYEIRATQRKMAEARLPAPLIMRLPLGR